MIRLKLMIVYLNVIGIYYFNLGLLLVKMDLHLLGLKTH